MSLLPFPCKCTPIGDLSTHATPHPRMFSRSNNALLSTRCANSTSAMAMTFPPQVVQYGGFISRPVNCFTAAITKTASKESRMLSPHSFQTGAFSTNRLSSFITPEIVNMDIFNRLLLAWKILFPKTTLKRESNAKIARQRLQMVLFSDRCAVSDLAKQKILENVVKTLSEFVEIESKDNVQLNVSTDSDIGTVYSVTIPVRRVKPAYQESDDNYKGQVVGIEYKDTGEKDGAVDVTFDFYVPNDK